MSVTLIIIVAIIAFTLVYLWLMYNSLVTARVRIKEAWSGIEVQLKRRSSLIPNLIETVKGYAKHEKSVFENVTKARSELVRAKGPKEAASANNMLADALKTLLSIRQHIISAG